MQSRRDLLKMFAVGGAVFATAAGATASTLARPDAASVTGTDSPWWVLHPLDQGKPLGKGWTVDSLGAIELGRLAG